jgi:phosphoglycerol transferase MdoB-like AlkP superfamily enzyme
MIKFKIQTQQFSLVLLLGVLVVSVSLLTRVVLSFISISEIEFIQLPGILFIGLFYDVVNALYFVVPMVLYLWLVPTKIFQKHWHRFVLYGFFTLFVFIILFNSISEFLFWDEFKTRFNFIAVDYLVYTTEVLGNIRQSYPIEWIIVGLVMLTFMIVFLLRPFIRESREAGQHFKHRSFWALPLLLMPFIAYFTISNKLHQFSTNMHANELAGNGMYELFSAYLNNELNYDQFYKTQPSEDTFTLIRKLLQTRECEFISNDIHNLQRKIKHAGAEKRLNVVLISVESLSADFFASFGNTKNITPFLDSLAGQSLFFTNLYATGTRTVRGLEALSLCIPPTPGQSIVRRPNNENLYTLGKIFKDKGYESKYIYGGYGYFDNMSYFFSHNNYEVVDRGDLKEAEIDYENVWGVADENLFMLADREIEKSLANNKPVFAHIMTTSNHRPFTYPEGRIDIPSHTSREGAVKYTDYAIGKFIKACRNKSWFNNTLFVIVADHCASSAGKSELPVDKYHIPLIIYSPKNVPVAHMDRLMSQIDIGPTGLGLLNFSYTSNFFGYDMFELEDGRERAFISTYQNLGFLRKGQLVILSPQKKVAEYTVDFRSGDALKANFQNQLINESIAWYQVSSSVFREGRYRY